jgi:hypothetical protein
MGVMDRTERGLATRPTHDRSLFVLLALATAVACKSADDDDSGTPANQGGSAGSGGSVDAAAGSSSGEGSATGGTGGTSGSGSDRPDCNQLTLDGPSYSLTSDPNPAPDPLGGTIVAGTYVLTSVTAYQSNYPDFPGGRIKLEISDSTWQDVESADPEPGPDPDHDFTLTYSTDGTSLTLVQTCPPSSDPTTEGTYTATDDSFTFFVTDHGVTFGSLYTRQ